MVSVQISHIKDAIFFNIFGLIYASNLKDTQSWFSVSLEFF